jgi:mRNA interferase RelE/StbE
VTYRVESAESAEQELLDLPPHEYRRAVKRIAALAQNPRPPGVRKITGRRNSWRIRAGQYRIIYEIDDDRRIVTVKRVRHRKDAYR